MVQNGSQPERDDDVTRLATPPALQIRSLLNTIAIASTADPNAETKSREEWLREKIRREGRKR